MCADEDFLHYVLDIARVAQVARHMARDAPLVFDHQRLEGLRVPRLREAYEFRILVR